MIFLIAKKLWLYHLSMIDNFQKYIKITNFVSSKTENYIKISKTPVSDHSSISHKY